MMKRCANRESSMGLFWLVSLAFGTVSAGEADYLDRSLPRAAPVKPFEGERYTVKAPDTVNLAEHAEYALNQATRLWAADWGYEQFFGVFLDSNPPGLEMGHGGLLNCGPKVIEALPMLRVMTGNNDNLEADGLAMGSILQVTGKDGLGYQPVEGRPWAFFEDFTREIGKPYCDIFGEARQSLAFAAWYQHDRNPMWKELALRKNNKLMKMTLKKFDTDFFRLSRGYTPWDEDPTAGPVVPIGDHNIYDQDKGMVGTAASYIVGWMPMAGGIWHRLTDEQPFMDLAGGLARYLYLYGEMIDPETGAFLADHETHVTHSLLSNLSWALTAGHKPMIEWVRRAYESHIQARDPHRTGVIFGKEAGSVGDVIGLGVMLSVNGVGDYWENVDRWLRNTFLDMQVTEVEWIKSLPPPSAERTSKPEFIFPEDAVERCLGVWRYALGGRDWSIGCCNGNASRMLYYAWDNIVTNQGDLLRVNLLLNRASPWADVDSWLPYEGKVKVTMKEDKRALLVRVPEWTRRDRAVCAINGVVHESALEDGYLHCGPVKADDEILITFPVEQRIITANLNETERKVTLKGNTVVDMDPGTDYPLENHERYRTDQAPMKTIERFVSAERFIF